MTIESFGGRGDYVNIVDLNEKIVSNIRDWGKNDLVFDKLSVKQFSDGSFRIKIKACFYGH